MPPKSKDVRELLLDLFTKQELRMFLADFAEYEDFDDGVNWGQNFKSAAHDVVERLEARGLVDSTLRGRLLEERSGRAADIESVFGGSAPVPTPVVPMGSPPALEIPWWRSAIVPWDQAAPRQALDLVTGAYPRVNSVAVIASYAGIGEGELDLTGSAREAWTSVFNYAARSGLMALLMERVLEDDSVAAFHPQLEALLGDFASEVDAASLVRGTDSARVKTGAALVRLGATIEVGDAAPTAGLQSIVDGTAGLGDPLAYIAGIANAMRRTAMIEVGGRPRGTGFLIGPQHLLTNAHVLRAFDDQPPAEQDAVAVFDFYTGTAASHAETGRRVPATYVAHSPPTEKERQADSSDWDAGPGFLDYCVLSLAEPVGTQPAGPIATIGIAQLPARGYFKPSRLEYDFAKAGSLVVVQHPLGEHQVMSRATPSFKVNSSKTRVRYNANTLQGSSGSCVVDGRGRLVALHHYALSGANQGVPIAAVAADLADNKDLGDMVTAL